MRKRTVYRAAAVLCATVLALSVTGCAPAAAAASAAVEETLVPVSAQTPTVGDLAVKNEFIGRVMPDQSVSVFAKMGGEVLAAPFQVGDTVRAGDLLLQVDGKAVYAQVNQAKAAYDSAKVNAEQALGTKYDSQLITLEAQLNSALAKYDQANRAVKDYEDEYGKTYGDNGTYRNLRASKSAAADAYYAAQAAYDLAKNAGYDDAVKASDAGLAQAEASYRLAAQSLDNLRVTAPISGVIEAKSFDVHDMASTQTAAYVISNKDVMTVSFNVPASAVPAMTIGDIIEANNNGVLYSGTIVEVGTIASEQSGLFPVKARIDGDISGLLSGISVKVIASAKKVQDVLLVPVGSISHENGRQYVYVVSPENTAVRTEVETGVTDDKLIEVVSGLSASDRIVTTWSPDLTDGAKLAVSGAPVAASAAASSATEEEPPLESVPNEDASSAAPAASSSQAAPVVQKPKTTTSQTAPASSTAASQSASSEPAPAKDRESLLDKAGEDGPPEPIVPDEIHPGDETGEVE